METASVFGLGISSAFSVGSIPAAEYGTKGSSFGSIKTDVVW